MTECPECSAPEHRCKTQFHEFLALEYADAAYGAVHHLTVAAYMVQHSSQLTPEGWRFERELLKRFLEADVSPSRVRREIAAEVDSRRREFKITSRHGQPLFDRPDWSRTIMNVRHETPGTYCSDITAWARSTLVESEQVRLEKYEA